MKVHRSILFILTVFTTITLWGCEGGLEPPQTEPSPEGVISGTVHYTGNWPPSSELQDLRFVPLKIVPQSPTDLLSDFQNLGFSDKLDFNVESDTFLVDDLQNGVYVYNVIAQQFGGSFDWRPVGVYEENDGVIILEGDTIRITIEVDFDNLPPFPPD